MRATRAIALTTVLAATLAAGTGCGNSGGGAKGNPDGFATTGGATVLVPAVTRVTFKSTGGGHSVAEPAGAACSSGLWTYTVDLTTGLFTWERCDVSGTGINASDYVVDAGSRTLPATQLETARAAIADVHVSNSTACGADKATWTFTVASTTTSLTYGDDFYVCLKMFEHYVVGGDLGDLQAVLLILAG